MNFNTFSVRQEYITPIKLRDRIGRGCGEGIYIKNGPAWKQLHDKKDHPFDCNGFITKITLQNGEAYYQGRYIKSISNNKSKAFKGPLGLYPIANVSNTNIIYWGGKLVSFFEGGSPYLIDFNTLDTLGTLHGYKDGFPIYGLNCGNCVNAHPFKDLINNRLILMELSFLPGKTIIIFKEYDNMWNIVHETKVFIDAFFYTHDFVVTNEYYIFCHHPLHINLNKIIKGSGIAMCLEQDNIMQNYIYYVHRTTGKITKIVLQEKGFISHLCMSYNNKYIYGILYPKYMEFRKGKLIKVSNGTGNLQCVSNYWCEFPNLIGKNIFLTKSLANNHPMQCISKIHNDDSVEDIYIGSDNEFVGEPIGDIKGNVYFQKYDTLKKESCLCVYSNDGKLISNLHISDEYVPLGLHGSFIDF
jgi:all-trans-8'-apo-beta-carotenal 15,15'-oxygenase